MIKCSRRYYFEESIVRGIWCVYMEYVENCVLKVIEGKVVYVELSVCSKSCNL